LTMARELDEAVFDQAVSSGLVVVDFWAPWCGPCRMMTPVVEELSGEYGTKVSFCKLNVDEYSAPAVRYQVMSIPTFLVFKDGRLVDRIIGALPKEKLKARINKHL